jgi:hypothetical protein
MCKLCVGNSILKGYYLEKLLHCPRLIKGLLTVLCIDLRVSLVKFLTGKGFGFSVTLSLSLVA